MFGCHMMELANAHGLSTALATQHSHRSSSRRRLQLCRPQHGGAGKEHPSSQALVELRKKLLAAGPCGSEEGPPRREKGARRGSSGDGGEGSSTSLPRSCFATSHSGSEEGARRWGKNCQSWGRRGGEGARPAGLGKELGRPVELGKELGRPAASG